MRAARRVFVTGIGLVTPLGTTTASSWSALVSTPRATGAQAYAGSGEQRLPYPTVVMRVPALSSPPPPLLGRDVPLHAHFALTAASEALRDAGLRAPPDPDRAGVSVGVGMAHVQDLVDGGALLAAGRARRVSPFLVPRVLLNTPAGLVSQVHGLRGPNTAPASACAAGAHAVLDGFRAVQRGDADVMVVGGTEAAIEDVGLSGFARAKALSAGYVETPWEASRPFDVRRDGFVMGEGAGMLVLEEEEAARRRGVTCVYAEVVGGGLSGDAWHVTSPPPDGGGAQRAMRMALSSAELNPACIDYVNAHATGTSLGDVVERRAIASVFPRVDASAESAPLVSSTKGAMGHLLGAAGAVEAAVTMLTVAENRVPPTLNLDEVENDETCDSLGWSSREYYVPGLSVERNVRAALSNAFGFGGTNACIVAQEATSCFDQKRVKRD